MTMNLKHKPAKELETESWYQLQFSTQSDPNEWYVFDGRTYHSEESVEKQVNALEAREDLPSYNFRMVRVTHREDLVGTFEREVA